MFLAETGALLNSSKKGSWLRGVSPESAPFIEP